MANALGAPSQFLDKSIAIVTVSAYPAREGGGSAAHSTEYGPSALGCHAAWHTITKRGVAAERSASKEAWLFANASCTVRGWEDRRAHPLGRRSHVPPVRTTIELQLHEMRGRVPTLVLHGKSRDKAQAGGQASQVGCPAHTTP